MRNDGERVCMVAAAEVVRVCSGTDNLSRNFAVTRLSSIPPSLLPCKTTEHHADRLQADVSFANSCAPRQTRGALAMGLVPKGSPAASNFHRPRPEDISARWEVSMGKQSRNVVSSLRSVNPTDSIARY